MPHTEKLRAAASRSYPSRSGKNGWSSCHRPMGAAAAMCRCVRQLLPERLRRVKVAQACRAFLAAAQRGREHAAGIGERRGREALPPTASAPAPSRSGSAAPPTGQSRPMHCRAAGRRGPAALPAQRRDKPRAAASGHFRAAAAGPAPRRGARGRACAENPDNTPAAPGRKPVQRLLRNALRQDGVVDDGHMSLQRARRDAGPAIRQKAEAEHGGRPVNVAISLQFAAKYTGTGNRQTSPCVL